MKKRLISFLMALCLLAAALPCMASPASAADWADPYRQIVDAYDQLEESRYRNLNNKIIEDNYFVRLFNMGCMPYDEIQFSGYKMQDMTLRYALYDISGNGVPELIIAMKHVEYDSISPVAVYSLVGDVAKPAVILSLAPYEWINILDDRTIAVASGRMGYYQGYDVGFYDNDEPYIIKNWEVSDDYSFLDEPARAASVNLNWKTLSAFAQESFSRFADVKSGDWYYDAVMYVSDKGLMTGVSAAAFKPNDSLSRAMLVTVLHRVEGAPQVAATTEFSDVPQGQWFSAPIAWASSSGIVSGYGEGIFAPQQALTREQMLTMLYRYAEEKGFFTEAVTDLSAYSDEKSISEWALAPMQWGVAQGLISGTTDGKLRPGDPATRAECATALMIFLENAAN